VLYAHGAGGHITPNPERVSRIRCGAGVFTGALLLCWPAFFNRYPLLYPDSITYLTDGQPVARALFLHQFSDYYGMRSLLYSLVILPFHWNDSPWPVVLFQALLAAYVLWLVARSLLAHAVISRYLLLVAVLSLLTSLSWFVSLILPDVLGPLLYLCAYLLVFARGTLSGAERLGIAVLAWWAAVSHVTHLALAAALCALLGLLWLLRCAPMKPLLRGMCELALVVLISAASQLALHAYLYGRPSLNGDSPPFLTARLIGDGPGRWYLQQNCDELDLALCDSVKNLPYSSDEFLWNPDGILARAEREGDERIRQEEIPFVVGVLRAYPREEFAIMAANFWQQLSDIGLWDLGPNEWALENLDTALPGGKSSYRKSWQASDELPLDLFSAVQYWVVVAALGAIVLAVPLLLRKRTPQLLGLGVIILSMLLANAFLTGAFSGVEERYQSRVVWLLPLLAGLLLIDWVDAKQIERRVCGSATWHERN
jgi:hypothetical protein